jgi:hypothetical protein
VANIILANKIADVVLVDGKCFSFLQNTTEKVTNPLSDVSGIFATCSDCFDSLLRIEKDQIVDIGIRTDEMNFVFVGLPGETATLIVNSVSFIIANVLDQLVWDYDGAGIYTFTVPYETISRTAGIENFDVVYTGVGGLTFTLTNFS